MCDCCYEDYLNDIEDMLSEKSYKFAHEMLRNIRSWIINNSYITEKQKTTIENIKNSVSKT